MGTSKISRYILYNPDKPKDSLLTCFAFVAIGMIVKRSQTSLGGRCEEARFQGLSWSDVAGSKAIKVSYLCTTS